MAARESGLRGNGRALCAKRFLEQVLYYDRRVEALLERVERSRARLERVTAIYGGSRGGKGDWTDIVAAVVEDDRRLNEEIDRLVDVKEQVRQAIGKLEQTEMAVVLEFRYLRGLSWVQIADRMHIDRRTALRLHVQALAALEVPEGFEEDGKKAG